MRWGALTRTLDALPREDFDLVHIHTPFVAHYAGVRFARRAGIACVATYHTFFEEYLHHYVPAVAAHAWPGAGAHLHALAVRAGAGADRALRADARGAERLRRSTTPIHVLPTGLAGRSLSPPATAAPSARAREFAPSGRCVTYIGRVAHEKNIGFLVQVSRRCARRCREAMLVIAGEGPARESLRSSVAALGLAPTCTSRAISIATRRCWTVTRRRMCSCSPRAPRRKDWCCLKPWRKARRWSPPPSSAPARSSCPMRRPGRGGGARRRSPPRWCGVLREPACAKSSPSVAAPTRVPGLRPRWRGDSRALRDLYAQPRAPCRASQRPTRAPDAGALVFGTRDSVEPPRVLSYTFSTA